MPAISLALACAGLWFRGSGVEGFGNEGDREQSRGLGMRKCQVNWPDETPLLVLFLFLYVSFITITISNNILF